LQELEKLAVNASLSLEAAGGHDSVSYSWFCYNLFFVIFLTSAICTYFLSCRNWVAECGSHCYL